MKFPFSTEQFLQVFENYNLSVYPVQIAFNIFALIIIILTFYRTENSGKYISVTLSVLWLWMGIVYHSIYFASINKAAYVFAVLFIIQAVLFIYEGVIKNNLTFEFRKNIFSFTGLLIIFYALVLYPLLGYFSGHVYPRAPSFGLPCPTVIFTFGIFLLSIARVRLYILIIPAIWALIGVNAAFNLGIKEDLGLLAAGALAVTLSAFHNTKFKTNNISGKIINKNNNE